jgi:hypothetical protein
MTGPQLWLAFLILALLICGVLGYPVVRDVLGTWGRKRDED